MDSVDIAIVGGGVVGLAIARAVAAKGFETVVLEQHPRVGEETTSRNSGVIHSGIYYPTSSLKTRLCVRGRELLYAYCLERGIDHRRCGKLIVAAEAQLPGLRALHRKAVDNGVADLVFVDERQVRELEPAVRCAAGLLSPSTGIIDVHGLLLALQGDFEAQGGITITNCRFMYADVQAGATRLLADGGGVAAELECKWLINSGGLHAPQLLRQIRGYPEERWRTSYFAKGNYFSCQGIRPFKRLVYPMPNNAGLGVHATLDLDGTTRFGPDVEWVDAPDYRVEASRAASFYEAIREYWPDIPSGCLQPAYAGVRPKLVGPSEVAGDFEVEGPAAHGIPGLINLLGIESPGLTSSMAIGEHVAAIIGRG
ncbi:MAG TPA: NAD(P)/FAD-dependent oxidoreductase [Steroidobacteraceae bacterium]|nr:NAD(P)/FAD-dependent oxidoreductase [Steroidobacteraceae bacterium]